MRSSSVPKRLPSSSRRSSTQSTSKTPAKAPEATIGGVKRAPSSLVQHTSSSGRLVRTRRSSRVRSTSSPASTPTMPSYLPPANWVSRWLPISTGGRWSSDAGAPREDVADAIDRHRAARLGAPGDEQVAHLLVRVGEREAAEAARLAGADLAGAHHGGPEARRVDAEQLARGHGSRALPARSGLTLPRAKLSSVWASAHGEGSAGRPRCRR